MPNSFPVPISPNSYMPSFERRSISPESEELLSNAGTTAQYNRPLIVNRQNSNVVRDERQPLKNKSSMAQLSARLRKFSFGANEETDCLPKPVVQHASADQSMIIKSAYVGFTHSFAMNSSIPVRAESQEVNNSGESVTKKGSERSLQKKISGFFLNLKPLRKSVSEAQMSLKNDMSIQTLSSPWVTSDETQLLKNAFESLTNVLSVADGKTRIGQKISQHDIIEAIENNNWDNLNRMLFEPGSPLRGLPLGAKNITMLAHKYPNTSKLPILQKALSLARGHEWSSEKPKQEDSVFNPGEKLRKFIEEQKSHTQIDTTLIGSQDDPTVQVDLTASTLLNEMIINLQKTELIDAVNIGFKKARELQQLLIDHEKSLSSNDNQNNM